MSLSENFKEKLYLKIFGLLKVPMINYVKPRLLEIDNEHIVVSIPLNRRTKNHLDCMYFGALCVGADLAGGFIAAKLTNDSGKKISFLFKDMQAQFLKRAEGETHFTCNEGKLIQQALEDTSIGGKRVNVPVTIIATVPSKLGSEPVATFQLTLSLKSKVAG